MAQGASTPSSKHITCTHTLSDPSLDNDHFVTIITSTIVAFTLAYAHAVKDACNINHMSVDGGGINNHPSQIRGLLISCR